tara:strand:- start:2888 stop:4096 length:1209 start_codon:yes stop_codon:yes gene_type:complete
MNKVKRLLILGAGPEQCIAINEAKDLGYKVFIADGNSDAMGLKDNENSYVTDISNKTEVLKLSKKLNIDGIFCHGVEIPETVAYVGNYLGLPCLKEKIAKRCTDKIERISFLKENNIPIPKFGIVSSVSDFLKLNIEFPCILKPIDSSGARGVIQLNESKDFDHAFSIALSFSKQKKVLVEQKLSGPELSTESIIHDGQIITFAVADRNYDNSSIFSPYFVEDGINFPSILDKKLIEKSVQLVEKTIKTLGINFGSAKGDLIIHQGEPHILEMACRSSGGWFSAGSIPAATGANVLRPLIQMSVGDKPDLSCVKHKFSKGCAQRYLIPKEEGILNDIKGIDEAINTEGIYSYDLFLPKIGERIFKSTNHSERYAQFIFIGTSREEAIFNAEKALNNIELLVS